MKRCRKDLHDYTGRQCKECLLVATKKWRETNRAYINEYQRARYWSKPQHFRDLTRKWNAANPDRVRAVRRKKIYGLLPEEYAAMLERQGGKCWICRADTKLVVDHDHRTGRVRGLLCSACNRGLGSMRDDTGLLMSAVAYLAAHSEARVA